jgi:hypothetical protein
MKIIDVAQRSPEWIAARLGLPTASRFSKILTPTGQLSKQSIDYAYELVAEWLIGQPCDNERSQFMDRGTELEPDAIDYYEFEKNIDVQRVGFCTTDDGLIGCSPDGLVGEDGGLEIKCPSAKVQIANILNEAAFVADHKCQVQGCLYVTGRQWWHLMSYHPTLPCPIIRVERDEDYIGKLHFALAEFTKQLIEMKEKINAMKRTEVLPEDWPFG